MLKSKIFIYVAMMINDVQESTNSKSSAVNEMNSFAMLLFYGIKPSRFVSHVCTALTVIFNTLLIHMYIYIHVYAYV